MGNWCTIYIAMSSLPLWRLSRNAHGRRLYDWLAAHGVRCSLLAAYVRDPLDVAAPERSDVALRTVDPAALDASFRDADCLGATDLVVVATEDGERVGSVLLTLDGPVYVDALERTLAPAGAYLWRLFVRPAARQRGLATALLRTALAAASDRGVDRASALVATDNVLSRRTFEAVGFDRVGTRRFLRLFGWQWRHATGDGAVGAPSGGL
jgi:ribosomal protein S18 acetylase RimI-like enzyme